MNIHGKLFLTLPTYLRKKSDSTRSLGCLLRPHLALEMDFCLDKSLGETKVASGLIEERDG